MENKYKTIPFDINRINEEGVKVVTRDGRIVRIFCTDANNVRNVFGLINGAHDYPSCWYSNGRVYSDYEVGTDLFLQVPIRQRRMTHQELSWWLRDAPEEHREWRWTSAVYANNNFSYIERDAHEECPEDILIRSNGEEWREPLIEIND